MNKFIYLALSLVSLLSFASCKDDDEKDEKDGKLIYSYNTADKTASVVGIENKYATSVKIPFLLKVSMGRIIL